MERGFLIGKTFWQRALGPLSVCLSVMLPATSATANSFEGLSWKIDQSFGTVGSQWREETSGGVIHVKESGALAVATTAVTASHPLIDVTLRYEQLVGDRRYQGVTNQGQNATSSSDVKSGTLGMNLLKNVNSAWALGVAIDRVSMHRDIRSTSMAVGYPEHYKYILGKVGVQHRLNFTPELKLYTFVWLGRSFDESLLLRLPGFDPAQMSLGHGRTSELGWRLIKSFQDSRWQASLKLGYKKDQFKLGDATTLFKGGRIAGSAHQPAWQHALTHLSAEVSYGF